MCDGAGVSVITKFDKKSIPKSALLVFAGGIVANDVGAPNIDADDAAVVVVADDTSSSSEPAIPLTGINWQMKLVKNTISNLLLLKQVLWIREPILAHRM